MLLPKGVELTPCIRIFETLAGLIARGEDERDIGIFQLCGSYRIVEIIRSLFETVGLFSSYVIWTSVTYMGGEILAVTAAGGEGVYSRLIVAR